MRFPPPADAHVPHTSPWKGKAKDISPRDGSQGGVDGTLIDLQLIDDSPYQSAYVAPIILGPDLRNFLVQVDTGSSDLWITSTACSSSLCNQVGGQKYDPSRSIASGQLITIQYAEGEADGPVVWDTLQLGGYNIDHQALIAAANVQNEPLSSSFNGVMGLALPLNSLIAQRLLPTTTDQPDGASLASNLFGITPYTSAPGARFLSLALERPGSDAIPSVLGIGRHPPDLIPDPAKIEYAAVVSTNNGAQWWQAAVHGITVWVDGKPKPISLPLSATGSATPSAILDSGVPLIITTNEIANGIYGAIGISPASDGNYYVPCTLPINMTIKLDGRSDIPLHPLDLTYFPPNDASSENCIGVIQTPARFPGLVLTVADMILGVPFLRNTYTVMAYDPPFLNGTFPTNSPNMNNLDSVRPRLGLMNLTDPAIAAEEFHQVRVLKQPLGRVTHSPAGGGKGLSVGIAVLIGLLGFVALCFILFGARWVYMKRKYKRERAMTATGPYGTADTKDGYILTALGYHRKTNSTASEPSEDELRQRRFEEYKRRNMGSSYTDETVITHVEEEFPPVKNADEFGAIRLPDTPDTPLRDYFDPWGDTLLNSPPPNDLQNGTFLPPPPRTARRSGSSQHSMHHRTPSGGPGADTPLLGHSRADSNLRDSDITELGSGMDRPSSMAGVGTVSRSRRFSSMTGSPLPSPREEYPPLRVRYSDERAASPPRTPTIAAPAPVHAHRHDVAAVLGSSRNESRVSDVGHGV